MTHKKYLKFLLFEDNDPISAKSCAQNVVIKSGIDFSYFEFFNYWFM